MHLRYSRCHKVNAAASLIKLSVFVFYLYLLNVKCFKTFFHSSRLSRRKGRLKRFGRITNTLPDLFRRPQTNRNLALSAHNSFDSRHAFRGGGGVVFATCFRNPHIIFNTDTDIVKAGGNIGGGDRCQALRWCTYLLATPLSVRLHRSCTFIQTHPMPQAVHIATVLFGRGKQ